MLDRFREWRWYRRRQPGLNTEADAQEFAAELKAAPGLLTEPEPAQDVVEPVRTVVESTPIHDALAREFAARRAADESETHRLFLALVAGWGAGDWRCDFCGPGNEHQWCPGCSCPCSTVEV